MEFGICFKGFVEADRARYLVRMAEVAGFKYCWFYDSHILWREPYPAWRCAWNTRSTCASAHWSQIQMSVIGP